MAQGEITIGQGSTIEEWLNEGMYQLSMKSGVSVNNVLSDLRNNITLDRVAIVLRFQYGPPVILGGIASWNGQVSSSVGGTGGFDPTMKGLANQVLTYILNTAGANAILTDDGNGDPTTGTLIKYVEGVVAPLDSSLDHITGAGLDQCTYWADGTTNDLGEGWGLTFGTKTAAGTQDTQTGDTHKHSIFINTPGNPQPEGYPIDTILFKIASGAGATAGWSAADGNISATGWGSPPDIIQDTDAQSAYNHGLLDFIDLYATIKDTVKTEGGGSSSKWEAGTWYNLLNHGVQGVDVHQSAISGDTELGINKHGWWGALDKDDETTALDVNDGVQDVRMRFSQGLNNTTDQSSKAWNPKDFLNWSVYRKQPVNNVETNEFSKFTNEYLLPSRVSVLSGYGRFINCYNRFEVFSSTHADQWENVYSSGNTLNIWSGIQRHRTTYPNDHEDDLITIELEDSLHTSIIGTSASDAAGNTPPAGGNDPLNWEAGDTYIQVMPGTDGIEIDRLLKSADQGDSGDIEQIYFDPVTQPGKIVIETNTIGFNKSQPTPAGTSIEHNGGALVADSTSGDDATFTISGTPWKNNVWTETGTAGVYQWSGTAGAALTGGSNGSIHQFLFGIADSKILDTLFSNYLTLVLFDPKLWWSDSNWTTATANTYLDPFDASSSSAWENRRNHGVWTGTDTNNVGGTFTYNRVEDVNDPNWWTEAQNPYGWKKYTDGRSFQRYNDVNYINVKVLAFQPHENFSKQDKLRITIPIGNSTA